MITIQFKHTKMLEYAMHNLFAFPVRRKCSYGIKDKKWASFLNIKFNELKQRRLCSPVNKISKRSYDFDKMKIKLKTVDLTIFRMYLS